MIESSPAKQMLLPWQEAGAGVQVGFMRRYDQGYRVLKETILNYQWNEVLIPYWEEIVALAREHGVERIALELHGNQCVYNVPSLLKLRGALGAAIYHVHAKDTMLNAPVQATTSLLENGSLMDIPARSWSYITLGFGHAEEWWRQFCYRLKWRATTAGYPSSMRTSC